jgi:hypothetical protein
MQSIYLSEAITLKDHDVKEVIVERNGMEVKILQLEGLFQRAEEENRNGRVYPLPILERENNKLLKTISAQGGLIGEMEHPSIDPNDKNGIGRATKILYERGCVMIKDLKSGGRDVIGRCEILEDANQYGSTLASMVRRGLKPGISSRAVGSKPSMDRNGRLVVGEDINFITYDIVSDPSVYNARLSAMVSEEVERIQYETKNGYKRTLWSVCETILDKVK